MLGDVVVKGSKRKVTDCKINRKANIQWNETVAFTTHSNELNVSLMETRPKPKKHKARYEFCMSSQKALLFLRQRLQTGKPFQVDG